MSRHTLHTVTASVCSAAAQDVQIQIIGTAFFFFVLGKFYPKLHSKYGRGRSYFNFSKPCIQYKVTSRRLLHRVLSADDSAVHDIVRYCCVLLPNTLATAAADQWPFGKSLEFTLLKLAANMGQTVGKQVYLKGGLSKDEHRQRYLNHSLR